MKTPILNFVDILRVQPTLLFVEWANFWILNYFQLFPQSDRCPKKLTNVKITKAKKREKIHLYHTGINHTTISIFD